MYQQHQKKILIFILDKIMGRYCFPLLFVFSSPSNQDGDMKLITAVLNVKWYIYISATF